MVALVQAGDLRGGAIIGRGADKRIGAAVRGGAAGIIQRRDYYQHPPPTSPLPIYKGGVVGEGAEGQVVGGQCRD